MTGGSLSVGLFLSTVQRYVLEPQIDGGRTWASGLWDREEVYALLRDTEQEFLRRTAVVRGWQEIPYAPLAETAVLDSEVQAILHADRVQAGSWAPLPLISRHEADLGLTPLPGSDGVRTLIVEDHATNQVSLVPPAAVGGVLHLLVVPAPQLYSHEDDPFTVGAMWLPFLFHGLLARMFGKPGEAYHAERQRRHQGVFELGISIADTRRPQ